MQMKDIMPRFGRTRESLPARRVESEPFLSLQREMNRLFDEFFDDVGLAVSPRRALRPWGERELASEGFVPRVDVTETDTEVRVSAELPGLNEKEVTVEVDDEDVTIRGEKQQEREEKGRNWFRREQSYGAFHRVIPLPAAVDGGKAKAKFDKGVLTVTAPKREDDRKRRKSVPVEAG